MAARSASAASPETARDPVAADLERVLTSYDTCYVWRYGSPSSGLRELYAKAKCDQWDGASNLDWSISVDPEEPLLPAEINPLRDYGPYKKMNAREQMRVRHCQVAWQLSQFMHGEQGALIVASQLVSAVPMMDAKLYAASQTMDEARHVEVFSRYLTEKIEWEWPVNQNLKRLLDTIIQDSRWDLKYLGMQILVAGLVIEACELMRDRLIGEETADYFGLEREPYKQCMLDSPILQLFRMQLFARIVPNLRRLGLLSPRVRSAFDRLGILQFEDADPTAQDAALGLA